MTRRIRVFPARPSGFARGAFGLVLPLLIPVLTVALPARAAQAMQLSTQQKQDVRLHYERATRAYDLNKYQEAVDEYQKVYEIDGDPVMLYNIGQAYRLNDQPQDSIHFYRRYLQRSPEAKNRDDVNRKIPLRRHAKPEEIAALFAYLASEDAAYATGHVYTMDGGETAGGLASR